MLDPRRARAVLRIALAALVVAVFVHTRADPDLWGHVRFGQDLVASHAARVADVYSFDSDRPWVNHEWLAEIVMYAAFAAGGSAGLILLKVALLIAMAAAASLTIRGAGVSETTHDLLVGILLVGTVPQASHVRPQLFSLALFAALLAVLVAAGRRPRAMLAAVPIMALWANVHGGWLVGAGTLAIWIATTAAFDPAPARGRILPALVAALAITATLLNPYGWGLWAFLRDTVGVGRPDIVDWQPVFRIGAAYVLLWALVAAAAAVGVSAAARSRRIAVPPIAVVAALGAGAFKVNRLLAFFAIAVVMLLNREIAGAVRAWRRDDGGETSPRGAIAAFVVGCAVLLGSAVGAARNATCVSIDSADYPEPEVVALIKSGNVRGRLVPWFGWGEYAIWHLGPAVQVSIDGRRETVYSDATVARHLRFYFVSRERQQHLDVLQPDLIWLPSNLEVAAALRADGWQPLFAGSRSVLLSRGRLQRAKLAPALSPPRCFPGP